MVRGGNGEQMNEPKNGGIHPPDCPYQKNSHLEQNDIPRMMFYFENDLDALHCIIMERWNSSISI